VCRSSWSRSSSAVAVMAQAAAELVEGHLVHPPHGRPHRHDPRPALVGPAERLGHRIARRLRIAADDQQRARHRLPLGLVEAGEVPIVVPHRAPKSRRPSIPWSRRADPSDE
jgi:hypothetical protein